MTGSPLSRDGEATLPGGREDHHRSPQSSNCLLISWNKKIAFLAALGINNETNGSFGFSFEMPILMRCALQRCHPHPKTQNQLWMSVISKDMYKANQILNSNAYSQIRCSKLMA
jgi:hypothetical protein